MRNWHRDRQSGAWHWAGGGNWRCYRRTKVEVLALNLAFDFVTDMKGSSRLVVVGRNIPRLFNLGNLPS